MKKYLLFPVLAVALTACDRNNDIVSPTENIPILPVKIAYSQGNLNDTAIMTYDGNKLKEIRREEGSTVLTFEYTGNLISKITEKGEDKLTVTSFEYTNGKLAKVSSKGNENDGEYLTEYNTLYNYNGDGTITANQTETTSSNGYTNTKNITFRYTLTNGQTTQCTKTIVSEYNTFYETNTFTYDTQNSIFKNVAGFNEISFALLEELGDSFSSTANNFASIVSTSSSGSTYESKYEYTYNASGYPTKLDLTFTYSYLGSPSGTPTTSTHTITYNK
ncbi:hypothetical protein [Bergeyella sp. RCAD1439]|uniref:hypothetical protein n=1 Tax=Bergeyella anatis TaxID=3113737 RepID=UPI002E1853E8|nr:hypothetical protein [Bergeyella sp. RCAD1439]